MTVDYVKYVIKKWLLSTYACIDVKDMELINDIRLLICNSTRFKDCDKILVCTKISEDNFVVEKYPLNMENGKKLKVITTVGRMESGQIKFDHSSVEKG